MKLITSMLILLALLELIVWTSSNHVNLKSSSTTFNTVKSLIKSSNRNSNKLGIKNKELSENFYDNLIHKESK